MIRFILMALIGTLLGAMVPINRVVEDNVVLVIDNGIDGATYGSSFFCKKDAYMSGVMGINVVTSYSNSHGSMMSKTIAAYMNKDKYCIRSFNVADIGGNIDDMSIIQGLLYAIAHEEVKVVNLSMSGERYLRQEHYLMNVLVNRGTKVVVAAGNQGATINKTRCFYFPACYQMLSPNFHVVSNLEAARANKGDAVTDYELYHTNLGSGTSFSTAIKSGKLAQ